MIDDGYGDLMPWEQLEELHRHDDADLWLRSTTRRFCDPGDPKFEEAVQEGRIFLWKALEKYHGHPEQRRYAFYQAKLRIKAVLFRKDYALTGHASMSGRQQVQEVDHLQRPVAPDMTLADLLDVAVAIDGIELAYHYGEIVQALNTLVPQHREYVVLRFWHGWTDAEISRHFGLNQSTVRNKWVNTIRPKLVERLDHLVGVA